MTSTAPSPAARLINRGWLTWYCYLAVGFFTYLLNIQGNILPLLQEELALSYRAASLHFSAIAAGMVVVGLMGERITRWLGRRRALLLATGSVILGAVALGLAPTASASIASCFLFGFPGSLIPAIVFGVIGEVQGDQAEEAFGEASAITYMFGILGPLAISASLTLALGWRSALVLGALMGLGLLFTFAGTPVPEPPARKPGEGGRLPLAFWLFWAMMACAVALEFSVLFWAPAYLERVAGLTAPAAAASAAAFSIAMILSRLASAVLVRRVAGPRLLVAALALVAGGFGLYWGVAQGMAAVAGLFLLGLGIAPLYPLIMGLALSAAGPATATASARFMLAVGLSILTMPTLLGALADRLGLHAAQLMLPGLALAALALLALGLKARTASVPEQRPHRG